MSLRSDLAAIAATPADGWTDADRAEHQAWLATWPAEEIAEDPDGFTIRCYFECKAVDAILRARAEADREAADQRAAEAERTRRWLAAEDEAIGGDEIPY